MTRLYRRPEVLAFLQDAREHPEEDAARLALADWLDEHGDPDRADFIRLQCALAPGAPHPFPDDERARKVERVRDLVARFGGGWAGPLWRWGGTEEDWHRGLLSAHLDRHAAREPLEDVLPWVDSVLFEVTGTEALRRGVTLLDAGAFNHTGFELRRPFREDNLLEYLGQLRECPCLRTLTLWWSYGMGRPNPEGGEAVLATSAGFFARLTQQLPVGRHLTHLGSNLALAPEHVALLRAGGVEPVRVRSRHWVHHLPPAAFRRRGAARAPDPRSHLRRR